MSTQTKNGGWLDDGITQRDAKLAEKQSKTAGKTPANGAKPTPGSKKSAEPKAPPAEKPRLSMRDKILATTQGIATSNELRFVLQDAKDNQSSQEVVDRFVKLIGEIDALAIYKLSQEMSEREAVDEWYSLSWREQEDLLNEWADEGDMEAKSRLEKIPEFYEDAERKENAPTKLFLREIVDRFVKPLKWINTLSHLRKFLDELVDEENPKTSLVKRIYNPRFVADKNGVRIQLGKEDLLYLPKVGVDKIARAWPYIKEVEARAKAVSDELNGLQKKATIDFTPVKISHGEEGTLFLSLSGKEACLMRSTKEKNGEVTVRIVEALGVQEGQLPGDSQLWDKRLHRPSITGGKWARVCKALEDWKVRREEAGRRYKEERGNLLGPLTDVATFSTRFEDQGLTRILRGEKGTAAFWRDNFFWGKKKGFFGIAVEHLENGTYILREVVSDFRFPEELVGEKLPLVVDHDEPSVQLEQLPRTEQNRYTGLKMVEKVLQIRLEAEARNARPEKAESEQEYNKDGE